MACVYMAAAALLGQVTKFETLESPQESFVSAVEKLRDLERSYLRTTAAWDTRFIAGGEIATSLGAINMLDVRPVREPREGEVVWPVRTAGIVFTGRAVRSQDAFGDGPPVSSAADPAEPDRKTVRFSDGERDFSVVTEGGRASEVQWVRDRGARPKMSPLVDTTPFAAAVAWGSRKKIIVPQWDAGVIEVVSGYRHGRGADHERLVFRVRSRLGDWPAELLAASTSKPEKIDPGRVLVGEIEFAPEWDFAVTRSWIAGENDEQGSELRLDYERIDGVPIPRTVQVGTALLTQDRDGPDRIKKLNGNANFSGDKFPFPLLALEPVVVTQQFDLRDDSVAVAVADTVTPTLEDFGLPADLGAAPAIGRPDSGLSWTVIAVVGLAVVFGSSWAWKKLA